MAKKRVLVIGRFQPFHHGHLHLLRQLLKRYQEVIIAIGSAEQTMTLENPFTAGERIEMIRSCLSKDQRSRVLLVPVRDIRHHALWVSHLRAYVPHFDTVYSNNDFVALLFARQGIAIKKFAFFHRDRYEGRRIRAAMLEGKQWKSAVPLSVSRYIGKVMGISRLQRLANPSG